MSRVEQNERGSIESKVSQAWEAAYQFLWAQRTEQGNWTGELSTSALSTATAISALEQVRASETYCESGRSESELCDSIEGGCRWLAEHQNSDGGFGDTDRSHSNISTTLLVLSAFDLGARSPKRSKFIVDESIVRCAWDYVDRQGSWDGLRARYGKDKTFVVPILSNCALAGFVSWKQVSPLPFEAAWLPQDWYRWARMPVVSYAVPALVAIGQASLHHNPPRNPLIRTLRKRAVAPTLEVLRRMQPESGGYLEAVPLTSFVLMNLASIGHGALPVSQECLRFLLESRLDDGSWPIDTNLATWVTSLSLHSASRRGSLRILQKPDSPPSENPSSETVPSETLDGRTAVTGNSTRGSDVEHSNAPESTSHGRDFGTREHDSAQRISIELSAIRWLLACQHTDRHPFTGANPGGWGWTNLSGAVPDADDTPAALIALRQLDLESRKLSDLKHDVLSAVGGGLRWLCRLQNRDGGMPTFCRGWGKLPFDRSGTDLTAHALRAIHVWLPDLQEIESCCSLKVPSQSDLQRCSRRGLQYLTRQQQKDGSWLPLWFGNQDRDEEDNPVYGTGKVLLAYADLQLQDCDSARRGADYLRGCQNADGGWGGGASVVYKGTIPPGPNSSRVNSPRDSGRKGFSKREAEAEDCCGSSTIEETAIALEGLLRCQSEPWRNTTDRPIPKPQSGPHGLNNLCAGNSPPDPTIMRGLDWLSEQVLSGNLDCSWPIGFYFAKLWYHERLYPAIFSLGALGTALSQLERN